MKEARQMEIDYSEMTAEYLGTDATDQDLHLFREACERVLPAFEDSEYPMLAATGYIWNDGLMLMDTAGICYYCDRLLADAVVTPKQGDDEAWAILGSLHDDGCEWITTRAHRQAL
jgi:hypothetical protein